jgi:hypothetical protein
MEAEVQVKERPILFSTPMVKAILEGRKTVTRRVVTDAVGWDAGFKPTKVKEQHRDGIQRWEMRNGTVYGLPFFKCPYDSDVLWVRETWTDEVNGKENWYSFFKADFPMTWKDDYGVENTMQVDDLKWKPSIFMPKHICRLRLKIKSIRVERLHDITEEDAIREGVEVFDKKLPGGELRSLFKNYGHSDGWCYNAKASFYTLWQSINGEESWEANPWVWRIEFEKL